MPNYTARIHVLSKGEFYEEVLLDIQAGSYKKAETKMGNRMRDYIKHIKKSDWKAILFGRTKVVENLKPGENIRAKHKEVKRLPKPVIKAEKVSIIDPKKFTEETKVSFKAPMTFERESVHTYGVYTYWSGNRGGHRYRDW